jgi:hypothetical protein
MRSVSKPLFGFFRTHDLRHVTFKTTTACVLPVRRGVLRNATTVPVAAMDLVRSSFIPRVNNRER